MTAICTLRRWISRNIHACFLPDRKLSGFTLTAIVSYPVSPAVAICLGGGSLRSRILYLMFVSPMAVFCACYMPCFSFVFGFWSCVALCCFWCCFVTVCGFLCYGVLFTCGFAYHFCLLFSLVSLGVLMVMFVAMFYFILHFGGVSWSLYIGACLCVPSVGF